jgi:hypothetical protein
MGGSTFVKRIRSQYSQGGGRNNNAHMTRFVNRVTVKIQLDDYTALCIRVFGSIDFFQSSRTNPPVFAQPAANLIAITPGQYQTTPSAFFHLPRWSAQQGALWKNLERAHGECSLLCNTSQGHSRRLISPSRIGHLHVWRQKGLESPHISRSVT